ncbi:U1 small nuclear ribonucleoprotein [Astathelohania contejeani]|uniref:U1 small nuclear ribonucleoprotein n=1 Tax=Astathelohania contejeani TaxID=164912 RepID=A0ABQ7I1I6_9MICR|nr:U1 small nuclear ribonucleoprotein [Thelohania contejeani]
MESATLYIHNLHEGVKVPEMKRRLTLLFSRYRPVKAVYIRNTYKLRGQAFIEFENIEDAKFCLKKLQHLLLFDKRLLIEFARHKTENVKAKRMKLGISKSLLISNLPLTITLEELDNMFGIYEGFERVRYIKPKNICIVDFSDTEKCSNCYEKIENLEIKCQKVEVKYL